MPVTLNSQIMPINIKDYIPFISTGRSLKILYDRCKATINFDAIHKRDYRLLSPGGNLRHITLLIPGIGNLIVAIYDLFTMPKELEKMAEKNARLESVRQTLERRIEAIVNTEPFYFDRNGGNVQRIRVSGIGPVVHLPGSAGELWAREREIRLSNLIRGELDRIYQEWDTDPAMAQVREWNTQHRHLYRGMAGVVDDFRWGLSNPQVV